MTVESGATMALCALLSLPRPKLLRSSLLSNDCAFDVASAVGTSELVVDIVFASAVARLGKGRQRALVASAPRARRLPPFLPYL